MDTTFSLAVDNNLIKRSIFAMATELVSDVMKETLKVIIFLFRFS